KKWVASAPWRARRSSRAGVCSGCGPSSKVSATALAEVRTEVRAPKYGANAARLTLPSAREPRPRPGERPRLGASARPGTVTERSHPPAEPVAERPHEAGPPGRVEDRGRRPHDAEQRAQRRPRAERRQSARPVLALELRVRLAVAESLLERAPQRLPQADVND